MDYSARAKIVKTRTVKVVYLMPRTNRKLLFIGFIGFVAVGMPAAGLGVAWASMQQTFGVSLDSIGVLLGAVTVVFALTRAEWTVEDKESPEPARPQATLCETVSVAPALYGVVLFFLHGGIQIGRGS
jgi:hypothetical protein